jgi:hypothetical protein
MRGVALPVENAGVELRIASGVKPSSTKGLMPILSSLSYSVSMPVQSYTGLPSTSL